jgi:putative flippase GtrA
MIEKIKALLVKYRELIIYGIVGVITTIVNWGASFLLEATVLDSSVPLQNTIINVIAWIAAVVVSFPMNRKWVFQSRNPAWIHEFLGFTASRITTLLIEELIMLLCVNLLGIDFRISKIFIASVLVIILNYVFSKLLVFRKGQKDQ